MSYLFVVNKAKQSSSLAFGGWLLLWIQLDFVFSKYFSLMLRAANERAHGGAA